MTPDSPVPAPARSATAIAALVASLVALSGVTAAARADAAGTEPIKPIPLVTGLDARKVALGKKLFHEPRLSRDGTVSCASCHDLRKGGTDRRARSLGIGGAEGTINSPSTFNVGLNFRQFWDGRAATLEEQLEGPMLADKEMGSTWPQILAKLKRDPEYATAFAAIYPEGIQRETVKNALVQFELSLSTPNSRFDKYLRGEATALSTAEKAGYQKFKSYGCTSCHQGAGVGGNMFQTFGVAADYFADRGKVGTPDFGRFNVTAREEDRFVFKVPSLRNVALTAPYFHDGSAGSLEVAVAVMGHYQLGRELSRQDIEQIVQFLHTLTGEYEGKPL